MSEKKKQQLGMNPSTAAARLMRDTLWTLVVETGKDVCHRCGENMSRDTFSIEHISPWLDSENPVRSYFDQSNISFSHLVCNIKDARNGPKIRFGCGTHQSYDRGCRCETCSSAKSAFRSNKYCPQKRTQRYLATGH